MNNMNNQRPEPALGISLGDIYFIVFRHKRAILFLTMLGLAVAAGYYLIQQPMYESTAKVLVKFIRETRNTVAKGDEENSQVRSGVDVAQGVILAEVEIAATFDLFTQVATNIGPEKILAKLGGGSDPIMAATEIRRHLKLSPGNQNGVITLTFTHPDPEVVRPVLSEIVEEYITTSSRVHSPLGLSDELLQEQITNYRLQVDQIDSEILAVKTNAGIVDVAEAKKTYTEEIARYRRQLSEAKAQLAGQEVVMPKSEAQPNRTSTNALVAPPTAEVARYKTAVSQVAFYQKKEDEFLFKDGYLETSKLVVENRENLTKAAKAKTELEDKYPSLADLSFAPVDTSSPAPAGNLTTSFVRVTQQQVNALQRALESVQAEAIKLNEAETKIADLLRQKEYRENAWKTYQSSLEMARAKQVVGGAGHIDGITIIDHATPPFKSMLKFYKIIAGLALGGLLAGLFWAFFYELYIDRTVKRASEVESKLHIPFFLAIPAITKSDRKQLAAPSRKQLGFNGDAKNGDLTPAPIEVNSGLVNHALDQHYDALRDRLVMYFESINLTRKPKLVAVTSAGRGAGVSTIASGLAASLSETGDGRVLLVDMNQENGGSQQFFHGKANCKLDDALLRDKRDEALVQERLYVVSEGSASDKLSRVLPKRFASLVPQLKASDYDYIIFDMPPVSQTSVTTRLAGFMDTVRLVIESEKTDRDTVQQAHALLSHSKANVTAVLNKTKQHVPGRLVHDINAKV